MLRKLVTRTCCCCGALLLAAATLRAGPLPPQHTISIRSDGRDELRISNGSLVVHHSSWSLPTNLVVDGVPRPLSWMGNTSAPVAVPIRGDYWVKKAAGRDGGYAVQRGDGFALAVADNPNGSDVYEFQLFAAPQAHTTDWMRVLGGGARPGLMNFAGIRGYVPQPWGTETTFSLTVDGTDELMFVNGNLVIRHLSWNTPTALSINGVPYALRFSGGLSDPIPLTLPEVFQFEQLGGRTTLYPVQTPIGLLIGADDELLGAAVYTWHVVAVPEPSSLLMLALVALGLIGAQTRVRRRHGGGVR